MFKNNCIVISWNYLVFVRLEIINVITVAESMVTESVITKHVGKWYQYKSAIDIGYVISTM